MSVEIEPTELGFQRPFTQEVSQILRIRNPNHTPIAFKVKTTAPKQYCVRPNSGRVEPGKEVEVTVLLQAMKQDPPLDAKCRDKFLVQSVAVTPDREFDNVGSIWQHVDDTERAYVQEKKIRVAYLPAGGAEKPAATPVKNGGYSSDGTHLSPSNIHPALRSPSPEETYTPNARSVSGPASKIEDEPSNAKSLADAKASASNPSSTSTSAPTLNSSSPSYEDMKAKLAEAQATIASYAQDGGLRLRKATQGESGDKTVDEVVNRIQEPQGVPLQVVAALCLISFLLAYLFF